MTDLRRLAQDFDLGKFSSNPSLARDVAGTLVLLLVVLLARRAVLALIVRTRWANEETRLRWRAQLRFFSGTLVALGLFLIWGAELRTLALSVVAVSVALVIATKELILCVMGAVVRASSRSFSVGDRIDLGGVRGDVIDTGLFATRILETGPAHDRTGRAVSIPNSLVLTEPVINETFGGTHLLHTLRVKVRAEEWEGAERHLLQAAHKVCETFMEGARVSFSSLGKEHGLLDVTRAGEPVVLLTLSEPDHVELVLRVPAPTREKGRVEQDILRHYLTLRASRQRRQSDIAPRFADFG